MRYCKCGDVAVDGGFDYTKACFKGPFPKTYSIEIDATKSELYSDWNNYQNQFGLILKEQRMPSLEKLITKKN
jgi:hypothetical protein